MKRAGTMAVTAKVLHTVLYTKGGKYFVLQEGEEFLKRQKLDPAADEASKEKDEAAES